MTAVLPTLGPAVDEIPSSHSGRLDAGPGTAVIGFDLEADAERLI
jgi:hypothetical protein